MSRRRRSGFTLVELMITLAVIMTLMAIIAPSIVRAKGEANIAACMSNLRAIGAAYTMYFQDNPASYGVDLPVLVPKYLKAIPTCPSSGQGQQSGTGGYWTWWGSDGTYNGLAVVACAFAHKDVLGPNVGFYGPQWSPKHGVSRGGNSGWDNW